MQILLFYAPMLTSTKRGKKQPNKLQSPLHKKNKGARKSIKQMAQPNITIVVDALPVINNPHD